MNVQTPHLFQNRLLNALTIDDLALIAPSMDIVHLSLRQPLEIANEPIEFVYFLESGLGSIVAGKDRGSSVEVGLFGREGMSGTSLALGDTQSPFDCYTQMSGTANRISSDNLRVALAQSSSLSDITMHYARALNIQTTCTAWANAKIKLEERLARWILMVDDRTDLNHFRVTHEFLAMMLGVRRAGVTVALNLLESQNMIKSEYREIFVLDRDALINLTQGTYGPAEAEYSRLTGISNA
jgi:CRP-like cAMP-binding protein